MARGPGGRLRGAWGQQGAVVDHGHPAVGARDVLHAPAGRIGIVGGANDVGSVLEERNPLARDIHDTLAQGFAAILMQLQGAQRSAAGLPPASISSG